MKNIKKNVNKTMTLKSRLALICCLLSLYPTLVLANQSAAPYTTAMRYNLSGQVTGVIQADPDGSAGPLHFPATRNTYNNGHLIKVESGYLIAWQNETIKPSEWPATTFNVENTAETQYNSRGEIILVLGIGSDNEIYTRQEYSYDERGRVYCRAQRMDPTTFENAYVEDNVCVPTTSAQYGADRITRFTYDIFNNVLKEERGVGTSLEHDYVKYTYEKTYLVKTVTDANGNLAEMEYDNRARKTKWKFPSKYFVGVASEDDYEEYDYDLNDNRVYLRKRDGSEIDYVFDDLNRMEAKDFRDLSVSDVHYDYNLQGLQTNAAFENGVGVSTTYNGFGELQLETQYLNGTNYSISHTYDKNGNRERTTYSDGNYFSYHHDGLDRLDSIYENGSDLLIQQSYDNAARPYQQTTAGNATTTVAYDQMSRANNVDYAVSGGSYDLTLSFAYNPAGQLVQYDFSNSHYDYSGPGGKTGSYYVNGLNQYETVDGKQFEYDANGNLTLDGERDYIYDIENRLIYAQDANQDVTLEYDPNGRLIEYRVEDDSTFFLYDGDNLIAEINNGAITQRYVHAGSMGTPFVQYAGSEVGSGNRVFLHKNHQGSVIATTANNGFVEQVNTYDAFGVPGAGNVGRFSYTGQMYLPELGLYHYRARVYDPEIGRFLQTDPIGYEDQMNLYAYVGNDPVNFVDPTGMKNCSDDDPNCFETPESSQTEGDPEEKSDEVARVEEVVVTGHKKRKPKMRFNINKELFFTASASGMVQRPTTQTDTSCPDGSTMTTTRFAGGLQNGEAAVHTHASGRGGVGGHAPYPSHGDGRAASQSSIGAAFVMTKRRVFTIEAMSNGTYRTTLARGNGLSKSERAALMHNMKVWEGSASGSSAGGGGCN